MFTGIVTHQARVLGITPRRGGLEVVLGKPKKFRARPGDSVAVNGICSTVAKAKNGAMTFDYMPETVKKTNAGKLRIGASVNLESPLTPTSLLSGHFVLGHVDGVGKISQVIGTKGWRTFIIAVPKPLRSYIAPKGSVTVEGVSLTVVEKTKAGFSVSLIPYTLRATNLGLKRKGDLVNVECDVLAKYIREAVAFRK